MTFASTSVDADAGILRAEDGTSGSLPRLARLLGRNGAGQARMHHERPRHGLELPREGFCAMTETEFTEGTVLTCTHEDCDCRLLVQKACHCAGEAGTGYCCTCGAPMVAVVLQRTG